MAGRPGRSGGSNRIDPALHVLRGTFNPTRHGAALVAQQPIWEPTSDQLAALGDDGRGFIARLRERFDLHGLEGELALECGHAVDRLAEIRRTRARGSRKMRLALEKAEQVWQRQLTNMLASLRVRP